MFNYYLESSELSCMKITNTKCIAQRNNRYPRLDLNRICLMFIQFQGDLAFEYLMSTSEPGMYMTLTKTWEILLHN